MKIEAKIVKELTFQVYACWSTEGGMEENFHGAVEKDLKQALVNLDLAKIHNSSEDWFIKCEVETKIS